MDKKTLKKEFKKICKNEKRKSYRFNILGGVLGMIGVVITVGTFILDQNTEIFRYLYPLQIVIEWCGAALAVTGGVLDVIGEKAFKTEFEEYIAKIQK